MPSSLIVRCVPIKNVRPHPNADNLLIIDIMGWQVCTHKDTNPEVGDLRVFIPPDAILPQELAEQLDVVKYLKKGNRVGQVKLRQEMSFGIAAPNVWNFSIGEEVSEKLGIIKYEPPIDSGPGMQAPNYPLFVNYASIENFRNFPEAFEEGEEVFIFEKIEGTNAKVGGIRMTADELEEDGYNVPLFENIKFGPTSMQLMIGSHATRKKFSDDPKQQSFYQITCVQKVIDALKSLMEDYEARSVIFYMEIFGGGTPNGLKSMQYGLTDKRWRILDIYIDGKFIDAETYVEMTRSFDLPTAPLLYQGPFSSSTLQKCANQKTVLMKKSPHLSEGVVVRPARERMFDEGRRLILKYKSLEYETMKAKGKVEEVAS